MRKLVSLVLLLALLIGVDRVAAAVAEGQVARHIAASAALSPRPRVDVLGFPFLTQVARGRYGQIRIDIAGLQESGLRIAHVQGRFYGVHVALRDAMAGRVESVPVDRADAQVTVAYDDINSYLASRVSLPAVRLRDDAGRVRVTGSVRVPVVGTLSLSGDVAVSVTSAQITLRPTLVTAVTGLLPAFAQGAARDALTVRLPVRGLPFGVQLQSARVTSGGVVVDATASGITLSPGGVTPGGVTG